MAAFVLVHGSGQNAGSWSRVGTLLEERGHEVAAPDLPKDKPEWGIEGYAAEIARAIPGPRTIVVAHSQSGIFLPVVPSMKACALLVFLAAVIPEPGKSVRDQFEEDASMFSRRWIAAGPRWFDKAQEESLAREFLFHDCDEETLSWALGTMEMLNTRHLVTEPCPLATWPEVASAAIAATEDRTLTAGWARRASRRVLGRKALEIESGHCPQVSRPGELAGLLERLAAGKSV